jgi:hypothetical protein
MSQNHWTRHPVVAVIGIIASLIAIVAFVTGKAKLSDFGWRPLAPANTSSRDGAESSSPPIEQPRENEPTQITQPPSSEDGIAQRLGLVSGPCLSIEGPPLARGSRVFVVTLDPPHRVIWSEVLGQRTSGCVSGLDAKYRAYSLDPNGWGMTYVDTAVGLVGFSAPPTLGDGSLEVRFSDDPGVVTFRNCSSSEGFHITAWRNGERIWHVYTWVPYDTPNTCTPEETQ